MSSKWLHTPSQAGGVRARWWFHLYTDRARWCFALVSVLMFLAGVVPGRCAGAEAAAPPTRVEDTNSQETLRAYVHLQEQIHSTQLAIEQLRRDADQASAENAKLLASRLEALETALAAQRARELDATQSYRVMVIVAGAFAGVGVLGMLLMAYFQWRSVNRLAEMTAGLPALRALGPVPAYAALGAGESDLVHGGAAEQSNQRLLGALGRLEKRIYELEHTTQTPLHEGAPNASGTSIVQGNGELFEAVGGGAVRTEAAGGGEMVEVNALLNKGQSLLNQDNAQGALACFDEILKSSPGHGEALVKKGTALERLRKFDEALECYDRAIAADSSLTVAYLCKGGVFNRLERFSEALECYEKALHSQERRATG
jgi:tetratricopeptide (TPR) repeat protein